MNYKEYKNILEAKNVVKFRPKGHSMEPIINSGQLITVEKVEPSFLRVEDVVFCKVNGAYYVHLIKEIKYSDKYYLKIGNNKKRINGWTSEDKIYGKVVDIQD